MMNITVCSMMLMILISMIQGLCDWERNGWYLVGDRGPPNPGHQEGQEADGARNLLRQPLGKERGAQLHPAVGVRLPKDKHRHQRRTCREKKMDFQSTEVHTMCLWQLELSSWPHLSRGRPPVEHITGSCRDLQDTQSKNTGCKTISLNPKP